MLPLLIPSSLPICSTIYLFFLSEDVCGFCNSGQSLVLPLCTPDLCVAQGVWWINIKTRLPHWLPAITGRLVSCAGLDCLPCMGFWDCEAWVAIQGRWSWQRMKRSKKEKVGRLDGMEGQQGMLIQRPFHMWLQHYSLEDKIPLQTWLTSTRIRPRGQGHSGSSGNLAGKNVSGGCPGSLISRCWLRLCQCPWARRWTWQVPVALQNYRPCESAQLEYSMAECVLNDV